MRWLVCLAAVVALASVASAQSTGASFGGGDWGSSSSSSSDSSSWGSSSDSSSWDTSSDSSSWDSDPWDDDPFADHDDTHSAQLTQEEAWACCCMVALFFALSWVWPLVSKERRRRQSDHQATQGQTPPATDRIDVCALSIGIDWRARAFVQGRLQQLARGDTSSPAALVELLRQTVHTLTSAELGWLYAGASNAEPMPPGRAQSEFLRITTDLRSRFRHELLRNADGATHTAEAPQLRARPEEGPGVVVVSLVVAARTDLRNLLQPRDARALRRILEALARLQPSQLVAMEVIWSPAADNDRMSTAELEMLYPELRRIDEGTIAGRIFCPYCAGPYAAELHQCPHCGAPRAVG